ncbi:iron uptake system component EfeO [Williamsia limnetica]|uniref:Iron uptake system component EfeO n=1 Tax=Williamsia limnetica TaxID=882452 RepID=A0A318RLC1_WILLI|nr:iron uptake system protein EfeO [Williamsia limnetica]PYE19132.1 iron uptake system component EfeO [Williamsia limnetica]
MKRTRSTKVVALMCAAVAGPLVLAACTDKTEASEGDIAVSTTDDSCDLASTDAETGNVSFNVTNNGNKVTEFYVYGNNNRVLGEVENIGPGLTGKLTVEIVEPGKYETACKPGMVGSGIRTELNVTGETKEKAKTPADVEQAKASYLDYVRGQVNGLAAQTATFTAAVKAGDLEAAKSQFGLTRTFYERIEPVAESFPDLDPAIDMRWDDTEDGAQPFTGFHRLERFLWAPQQADIGDNPGDVTQADFDNAIATDNKAEADKAADALLANVNTLKEEVDKTDFTFETGSFVKGPQALIDEVAATKVGGEEDRYSHTDLWDFAANVDGSETLIAAMQPIISAKNPELMDKITAQFAEVRTSIEKYQTADGFQSYDQVPEEARKTFSDQIDALSQSLSLVPGLVMGQS